MLKLLSEQSQKNTCTDSLRHYNRSDITLQLTTPMHLRHAEATVTAIVTIEAVNSSYSFPFLPLAGLQPLSFVYRGKIGIYEEN